MLTQNSWQRPIVIGSGVLAGLYALVATLRIGSDGNLFQEVIVPVVCGIALGACGGSALGRIFEIWLRIGRRGRSFDTSMDQRSIQVSTIRYSEIDLELLRAAMANNDSTLNKTSMCERPVVNRQRVTPANCELPQENEFEIVVCNEPDYGKKPRSITQQDASRNRLKSCLNEQLKHSVLE